MSGGAATHQYACGYVQLRGVRHDLRAVVGVAPVVDQEYLVQEVRGCAPHERGQGS